MPIDVPMTQYDVYTEVAVANLHCTEDDATKGCYVSCHVTAKMTWARVQSKGIHGDILSGQYPNTCLLCHKFNKREC